jgi:hypothetical protein
MPSSLKDLLKLSDEFASFVKMGGEKRKVLEIQKILANVGKYIHFSDSDRAGITFNGGIHPGNPRGFYGFPLTAAKVKSIVDGNRDAFEDYGHKKFAYLFDVSGNILNLDDFNLENEFNKLLGYVKSNEVLKSRSTLDWTRFEDLKGSKDSYKLLWFISQIARSLGGDEHSRLNSLFRMLGYDALKTNKMGLGDDIQEQIVVLVPTSIKILYKLENPMALTKEEIEEDRKYTANLKATMEERERARREEKEKLNTEMEKIRKQEKQRLLDRAKYDLSRVK